MDLEDGLVQVSISLPKSLVSILPELMRVVTTACCSSYSWDSMKVSVNNEENGDKSSRVVLNLGKCVTSDSEVVQGKLHRCREQICKHSTPKDDLVGEVRITSFKQRTLKEYVKEMLKNDEEIEGTGWLEKELSDEMFFPSWYDQLRMNSVQRLGDGLFPPEKELNSSSSVIILNNVGLHNYYESENDEFFPLKCTGLKTFGQKNEETSDETFRLKKVCDRAKNCVQEISSEDRSKTVLVPADMQNKIRQLKGRLNTSGVCRTDVYEETYLYVKDDGKGRSEEKDYSYRQYLCYDEDLHPYPLCDIDGSSNEHGVICDSILPRVFNKKNRDLHDNFLRQQTHGSSNVQALDRQNEEDTLLVMSPTVKKTPLHRSFSANVVSHRFNDDFAYTRECSPSMKKREERKRPKSGPEKRVDFIRSSEPDDFSHGDSRNISDVQHLLMSGKTLPFHETLMRTSLGDVGDGQDQPKEKKKKRKTHHSPEKRIDEEKLADNRKETGHEHNRKPKERTRKNDDNERKDRTTKLVISYKSHDDETKSDLIVAKPKHRRLEEKVETKHQHRKTKRETSPKSKGGVEQPALRQEDLKDDGRRSRGKDEGKRSKRPKSAKTEQQTTHKTNQVYKADVDEKSSAFRKSDVGSVRDDKPETTKSWKKGFLGKRFTPPPVVKEETHSSYGAHLDNSLDDSSANKRDLSFLELISVVTDEVKHFGKRRENKRIRDKIT